MCDSTPRARPASPVLKVDQAIDLACNRYCPIHATLTHGTKIEHRRRDR